MDHKTARHDKNITKVTLFPPYLIALGWAYTILRNETKRNETKRNEIGSDEIKQKE